MPLTLTLVPFAVCAIAALASAEGRQPRLFSVAKHVSLTTYYAITTGWTNVLLDALLSLTRAPRGRPEDVRRGAPTSVA